MRSHREGDAGSVGRGTTSRELTAVVGPRRSVTTDLRGDVCPSQLVRQGRRSADPCRLVLHCQADDPTGAENVLDGCLELLLVTGAAVIDPDPMEATAVEEAKTAVADRAHDGPMVEMAAKADQNRRAWPSDQATQLRDQLSSGWSLEFDQRPRHRQLDPVVVCHMIGGIAGEGDQAPRAD